MKMKKALSLILCGVLAILLMCACGGQSADEPTVPATAETTADAATVEATVATIAETVAMSEPTVATTAVTVATAKPTVATTVATVATAKPTIATTAATVATTPPTVAATTPATKNNASGGINADFKAAMDSYEKFMDEYVAIVKKFKANPSDLSILASYTDYMSKYATFVADFEKWENEDLNTAELSYYIEVQGRVSKKLLEVAQ